MNDKCATRAVNYTNKFPWRVYIRKVLDLFREEREMSSNFLHGCLFVTEYAIGGDCV